MGRVDLPATTGPLQIKVKFPYMSPVNLSEQYYWLVQLNKSSFQKDDLPGILI